MTSDAPQLTRLRALAFAGPMVISNAISPLAGLVDTAVIAKTGDVSDVAGVGLGVAVFNLFIMTVYVLRISSTALASQAHGGNDTHAAGLVLARGVVLGAIVGSVFFALNGPIAAGLLGLFQGEPEPTRIAADYISARAWSAPALAAGMAMFGWLIGRGRSGAVMWVLTLFTTVNVVLDLVFVLHFNWGVQGVGAATAIAEWVATVFGAFLCWRIVRRDRLKASGATVERPRSPRSTLGSKAPSLWDMVGWRRFLGVGRDVLIRTWCLALGMSWFAAVAAREGEVFQAGTHVLLQIITLWAFVLDAFAFTAEYEVGKAVGGREAVRMRRAVRVTGELSVLAGAMFTVMTLVGGPAALSLIVADEVALDAALAYLPFCALIPLLGAPAWLMDGVFIGAARAVTMRNAMAFALAGYIATDLMLRTVVFPDSWAASAAWLAFLSFYIWRAAPLLVAYRRLDRECQVWR